MQGVERFNSRPFHLRLGTIHLLVTSVVEKKISLEMSVPENRCRLFGSGLLGAAVY
jgi:hypothetical protein